MEIGPECRRGRKNNWNSKRALRGLGQFLDCIVLWMGDVSRKVWPILSELRPIHEGSCWMALWSPKVNLLTDHTCTSFDFFFVKNLFF